MSDELNFDIDKARTKLAEAQIDRDQEMFVADVLRNHADDHDRSATRLNHYINDLHGLIARKELQDSADPRSHDGK